MSHSTVGLSVLQNPTLVPKTGCSLPLKIHEHELPPSQDILRQLMALIPRLMYKYSDLADQLLTSFEERQKHLKNGAALKDHFYKLLHVVGRNALDISRKLFTISIVQYTHLRRLSLRSAHRNEIRQIARVYHSLNKGLMILVLSVLLRHAVMPWMMMLTSNDGGLACKTAK